jgi:hypothetical protein
MIEAHQPASTPEPSGSSRPRLRLSASTICITELTGGFDVENETLAKTMQGASNAGVGGQARQRRPLLDRRRCHPIRDAALQRASRCQGADRLHRFAQAFVGGRSSPCRAPAVHRRARPERWARSPAWTGRDDERRNPRPSVGCGDAAFLPSKWTDDGRGCSIIRSGRRSPTRGQSWGKRSIRASGRCSSATALAKATGTRSALRRWRRRTAGRSGSCRTTFPIQNWTRLAEMILQESEFADHHSIARMRAAINARLHKGSVPGEFGRSVLLFRGFPMQLFWMHGRRMLQQRRHQRLPLRGHPVHRHDDAGSRGAAAQASGQRQRPARHDRPDVLAQGGRQGGGFGISATSSIPPSAGRDRISGRRRPDRSPGSIDDLRHFFSFSKKSGHLQIFTKHPGRALRQLIQNNLPGSTLWYTRLAFTREVLDQMQAEIDPQYWDSFSRMEKRAKQDGTQFYWRPGHRAPDRLPTCRKRRATSAIQGLHRRLSHVA